MDRTGGDHLVTISARMQGAHSGLVVLEENCSDLYSLSLPALGGFELTLK